MPQASPSLGLLTMPAWLAADSARSPKLVSTTTRRNGGSAPSPAVSAAWRVA
jgi:hypothetical protein